MLFHLHGYSKVEITASICGEEHWVNDLAIDCDSSRSNKSTPSLLTYHPPSQILPAIILTTVTADVINK